MPDTPEITKRCVTMTSTVATTVGPLDIKATDYVRPDFLDAFLAKARTEWQLVEVSDEPDAGPGGYHGETVVPDDLDHPLAGQTFAATSPEEA